MRVLIADDDAALRDLLRMSLKMRKLEAVTVEDGEKAAVSAETEPFALIILDIHMPGCSGLEAAARIRETALNHDTPIIFLTGDHHADQHDITAATVLPKPFTMARLTRAINAALALSPPA
jgi:DNA-binding response OmpR family regulator